MYVVRRSFKCFGKCFTPGAVITDVARVKGFKSKLVDRKIIEVTEQNYESMNVYFKRKFGVDLPAIMTAASTEKPEATPAEPADASATELIDEPKQTVQVPTAEAPKAAKIVQPAKVPAAKVQAAKVSV